MFGSNTDCVSDMKYKLLLFDLDGTLLRSDKSISSNVITALNECREMGLLIGIATSRSEKKSEKYISEISPDIIISSGGALVKYKHDYIYKVEFDKGETVKIIKQIRGICGDDCEITVDTQLTHYWNYKVDPNTISSGWGESVYNDFLSFSEPALKICAEIPDIQLAGQLTIALNDCDIIKFSDSDWYKITKYGATKETAILKICGKLYIDKKEIVAFGDDLVDIGMLKLCGLGVAMGNALDEVKSCADIVIGTNDNDGIAEFLTEHFVKY